jgi:hypothetical protein
MWLLLLQLRPQDLKPHEFALLYNTVTAIERRKEDAQQTLTVYPTQL